MPATPPAIRHCDEFGCGAETLRRRVRFIDDAVSDGRLHGFLNKALATG